MQFKDPTEVEMVVWQMRYAEWSRGLNRARINDLFNGVPPYTPDDVEKSNIAINVNFLESTRLSHDARAQFASAFMKPGNYFDISLDCKPKHKRQGWSVIITKEVNRIMKRSLPFFECFRSKFASNILHGIGPSVFRNSQLWCPKMAAIEDVLIPSNTELTMDGLPFMAIFKPFTAPELIKLTRRPNPDQGWNSGLVERCIRYIDEESKNLMSNDYQDVWSPEKQGERIKGDGGFYAGDRVPTINVWDFYYWSDEGKQEGWRRKMMLDPWTTTAEGKLVRQQAEPFKSSSKEFIYNSGNNVFASRRQQIINFQFADLSAVAPFHYHTVRSLGFLMYAICHLQNRLRCKFSEAVFEALMMYFRIKSEDDMQRALKLDLISRGFIDDSIQFVPQSERFQVNSELAQAGIRELASIINQNAASYISGPANVPDKRDITATQFMGEVQKTTQLVSAALTQAYQYQEFEYYEIMDRFCKKNSTDPDVVRFQGAVARAGVPLEYLNVERMDLKADRVMGGGNKTLELAIANQLMQWRTLYDPASQRKVLRDATLAVTDDAARAVDLVPDEPVISDTVHDAQLAAGTLMQGLPVAVKSGINQVEYVEVLLETMAVVIAKVANAGGMATLDQITGLQNVAQHIGQYLALLAQNPENKQIVRQFGDQLGRLMNEVKAFGQRLAQQMQAQQEANGGMDASDKAKLEAQVAQAKIKQRNTAESHAQRTAQRQVQFEMQQQQNQADAELSLKTKAAESAIDLQKQAAELELKKAQAAAREVTGESEED